jgi:hypothetical protein
MQDTQVKTMTENQTAEIPVQQSIPVSRFDDAEYERWSEKIRSASSKANKGNQ